MGYGARARRVPAKGAVNLADVDVYKLGLMCKTERGVAGIHRDIYGETDFQRKCGSYLSSGYGPDVVKSFFDTLEPGVNVELKVLPYVASDAAQSEDDIEDGTPDKIFTISAALKGANDKSAFGNKIGHKISQSENHAFKLSADSTGAASILFAMTSVEHLKVGYIIHAVDTGTAKDSHAVITAVDQSAKTISFADIGNATAFEAATTTLTRMDWNLEIAVKDDKGVFQKKEEWLEYPMFEADTDGMVYAVNHSVTGSYYVKLAYDNTNASGADKVTPAAVTSWTALSGGSDGTGPTDGNWDTLGEDFKDEDVMIFGAPESSSSAHNANMADLATDNLNFCYFGQGADEADEDSLRELGLSLRAPIKLAMIPSDKWLETDNPLNEGVKKHIPAVGYLAAHWFNMYSIYGIGKVAAGNVVPLNTTDTLLDSNELIHNDIDGKGDRMIRKYSVNILKFQRGFGISVNSARTLSSDAGYIFQNQVMGFLLIKKSILTYLRSIEQDPSGVGAQGTHKRAIFAYLLKKYDAGVFYKGQKDDGTPTVFEDVVTIVNDFSINTLANIANGIEETFCQVIFTPPIEEPILSLASASITRISS